MILKADHIYYIDIASQKNSFSSTDNLFRYIREIPKG